MRLFFICSLLCLGSIAVPAYAQMTTAPGETPLTIGLEPQFPSPGETVTATIDDYSINSTGATISWYLDGKMATNTQNKRAISLTAPAVGTRVTLTAQLRFADRPTVEAQAVIAPIYFDLIVEPQTYTPVFYAGRALPVYGSLVNVTALIHDRNGLVPSSEYSYNWQLNNNYIYGGPRVGAYRTQFTVPNGRNSTLSVTVQNKSGEVIARKHINIPSVPVELVFYEQNALYGLSQRAIGSTLQLLSDSSTIRATPYYLDIRAVQNNNLFSRWSIDGVPVQTNNSDPFEINLSRANSGKANVNFSFRNLSELVQGDEASFTVQF